MSRVAGCALPGILLSRTGTSEACAVFFAHGGLLELSLCSCWKKLADNSFLLQSERLDIYCFPSLSPLVGFSPFSPMTSHNHWNSLPPGSLPSPLPLRKVLLLKALFLITCRLPGEEMGIGHLYPYRLGELTHPVSSFLISVTHSVEEEECTEGVGSCPFAKLSWGLCWLLSLKAPCSHRGDNWVTCLYCEGLKSHIMHRGSQVLHRGWENGDAGSGRLVGGLRGSRQCLDAWVNWTTCALWVLEGSETLEHPYFSLLPVGSPQSRLFSPVKVVVLRFGHKNASGGCVVAG